MLLEKETLLVDRLPDGTKELTLDVLMLVDGDKSTVGTPLVKVQALKATVVDEEVKGDKLRVIRYKAKKRVHKEMGHRQKYSRIQVGAIGNK